MSAMTRGTIGNRPTDRLVFMSEIGQRARHLLSSLTPPRTQAELAAQVSMTPDALSRSLSGQRGWAITELVAVAGALGTSTHWLATGEADPFPVRVAARHGYDHDAKMHASIDWQTARSVLDDVALAYEQVEASRATMSRTQSIAGLAPATTRAALVRTGGPEFVRDLADVVAGTFDVDVVRVAGVTSGYSLIAGQQKIIVVSDTSNWFHQNWSIAHELGHFSASSTQPLDAPDANVTNHEIAANAYAAELLLPEARLRQTDWGMVPLAEVGDLVWQSGVSTKSLLTRLRALRIPLAPRLEAALTQSTQRFLRSHAPLVRASERDEISVRMAEASTRRFPMSLLTAHRDAIEAGRLPASTLAWMLSDDPNDIEAELVPQRDLMDEVAVDELASILGFTN